MLEWEAPTGDERHGKRERLPCPEFKGQYKQVPTVAMGPGNYRPQLACLLAVLVEFLRPVAVD